jgi:hypothetical protein
MKDKLLLAENCVPIYLNWFEEGGAEVFRINYDTYVLFEIPQYGGHPRYVGTYSIKEIDTMIALIESWT